MRIFFKKEIANFFAFVLTFVAISTVNSACVILFGQEKEPKTLERFKKNN